MGGGVSPARDSGLPHAAAGRLSSAAHIQQNGLSMLAVYGQASSWEAVLQTAYLILFSPHLRGEKCLQNDFLRSTASSVGKEDDWMQQVASS